MRSQGDRWGHIADFRNSFEIINWLYLHSKCGIKTKTHFECLLWHWSSLVQLNLEPTRPTGLVGCKVPTVLVKISVKEATHMGFCEARRASHCHSPQTTFSSNSACYVLSTHKSAMHVVVYADRLTTQHSIVDIAHWSWSYWQFWYPRWHVECFWPALAAHWISSASHTSVLPQHPRRKIVPYRVGWNHHTCDYHG